MKQIDNTDGRDGAPLTSASAEAALMAGELGQGYREAVAFFHETIGYPLPEAVSLARQDGDAEDLGTRLLRAPPEQVAWHALAAVAERSPEVVPAVWERLIELARAELTSGRRAAGPFREGGDPFDRARFLGLRAAYREALAPRGAVEDTLVDTLVQAQSSYLAWLAPARSQPGPVQG